MRRYLPINDKECESCRYFIQERISCNMSAKSERRWKLASLVLLVFLVGLIVLLIQTS